MPGRRVPIKKDTLKFVLDEHWASHHHFDFRLERRGVLKSWAIPKGLPKAVGERKLAVVTENHPMKWFNFQGIIPEGEYGAGKVKIKDRGTYTPIKWTTDKIEFVLHGKIFKGKYAMIPFAQKGNWLIIKARD